jgi:hypothetical protein
MRFLRKLFGASVKPIISAPAVRLSPDVRAESQIDRDVYASPEAFRQARDTHGDIMADGVLVCSCGTDTPLVHWGGPNPLKYVKCRRYSKVFVDGICKSSAILTPLPFESVRMMFSKDPSVVDRCGRICDACGLSRRCTEIGFERVCDCGVPASRHDVTFSMGDVKSFRLDPVKVTHDLRDARITRHLAVDRPAAPVADRIVKVNLNPSAGLGRRNAVRRPNHPLPSPLLGQSIQ